jgi:thiol-disulfide isomerase/thioredoxin
MVNFSGEKSKTCCCGFFCTVTKYIGTFFSWCGPCKRLLPILTQKAKENTAFDLVKVDID